MRLDSSSKHKCTFLLWWAMVSLLIASPAWPATQVELKTAVEGDLRPTIEGNCNLPDGMKLIVRVTRKESAFKSDTPVEVQSGHFAVGPLMQGSADLNPGELSRGNYECASDRSTGGGKSGDLSERASAARTAYQTLFGRDVGAGSHYVPDWASCKPRTR